MKIDKRKKKNTTMRTDFMPTKAEIKARKKFLREHKAFMKKMDREWLKLYKKGKKREAKKRKSLKKKTGVARGY